jgi:2'-5' RNA ligase
MAPARLFVALEVPEPVRHGLSEVVAPWRSRLSGARWTLPESWHVTLLFLGATDEDRIGWIQDRLAEVTRTTPALRTSLTRLGGFPSSARAKIVWAGLDDSNGPMARLAASVAAALETRLEHEPFSPHVTLARAHRPVRLPKEFTAQELASPSFDVTELVLFRSHLGGGPPRYEPLARLQLPRAG